MLLFDFVRLSDVLCAPCLTCLRQLNWQADFVVKTLPLSSTKVCAKEAQRKNNLYKLNDNYNISVK